MKGRAIQEKDKWGALECIYSGRVEMTDTGLDENDRPYVINHWFTNGHILRCLCGKEFTVEAKKFRGKRVIKDCGCGRASGSLGAHVVISFSTDQWTAQQVKDIANMDGQTVSYTITAMIREGMERRQKELKPNGQDTDNWDERRAQ